MDGHRFDRFSRLLATSRNRRQVLVAVVGSVVGIVLPRGQRRVLADCAPNETDCGGVCADLMWSKYYCGDCSTTCVGPEACCSGTCANIYADAYNCGGCGDVCEPGMWCENGSCMGCMQPGMLCGDQCVNPLTDTFNCGYCGNACVGEAPPGQSPIGQCVDGQCEIVCEPGYYNCGQGCSDLLSDSANCGACWSACPGGQLCQNGICVSTCPPELTDCGGACVDTAWDAANCGGCGIGCASQSGWGLCCWGSCVDPDNDPDNCGECGNECASGATCVDGVCQGGEKPTPTTTTPTTTTTTTPPPVATIDRWNLWSDKTQLRGAHVLHRRVNPDQDDPALGAGPVGPDYDHADFDRLAARGANYVELVHPVPFTQNPPYKTYTKLRDNLDRLVDQAARAGLFVVIGFRNGPDRSEQALDSSLMCRAGGCLNTGKADGETGLWDNDAAQAAWAEAWKTTARRYRDHPAVIGYDLLVAPDAPSLTNWEDVAGRLTTAVRDVDPETPVLISLPSNSADLLDFRPPEGERLVFRLDLLPPERYLLQTRDAVDPLSYPDRFDPARDDEEGRFDRAWIEDRVLAVEAFGRRHDLPVAIGSYGTARWQPGSVDYLTDLLDVVESATLNHGLWLWYPDEWTGVDAFDIERGTDPDERDPVANDLFDAVRATWRKNKTRLESA